MYTVKAFVDDKEYVLHDPKQNLFVGGDGYFETGDNINGQAEFTVYPDHPNYEYVKKLTTDVVFYNDGVPEFYGRILYDDEDDFSGAKKVFCEGELAFFCDSIQPIKEYQDFTVSQYLKDLIDIHNSQVEERKQFVLGRVTVTDSNDSLYRYSNYNNTRELLKDRLTDRLGGHFVVRHENDLRYLDYLSDDDFYRKNAQTIEFGKNLLDFSRNIDASEIATRIIPLGAKTESDSDKVGVLDDRLTIADVNGGVIYVTDNTESKIVLSASSLKEYVSRKNYIVNGEQETLALSKFAVSGTNSSVTVTEAEYLNMKCFKIAFKAAGTVTIKQSVGNLEEGTYTIAADGAYPSGKRPNTVRVGFDGNLTSFDLSSYTFEEFHLYKKEVKITAAAKTVAVTVQGSAGSEYYVTNIRCLRDLTEMIDNVSAKITTEANRITAEVNSKFKNYLTTEEINSKIEVAQQSILLNVSQNYTTTDQSKRLYSWFRPICASPTVLVH